jgi:hypothetical protein
VKTPISRKPIHTQSEERGRRAHHLAVTTAVA